MRRFVVALILITFAWPAAIVHRNTNLSAQQRTREVSLSVGQNQGTFLILTDIHFDPFADDLDPKIFAQLNSRPVRDWQAIFRSAVSRNVSKDGQDANYALFVSALNAAKTSGQRYDYVLVMGDYLTHNFPQKYAAYRPGGKGYEAFAIKTMVFVSQMIQQTFPMTPVYGVLGNNDSTTGDYAAPGDALLGALSKDWKIIAADRGASKSFAVGGYYALPHPIVRNSEIIVLNSTFFSSRYDTPSIAKGNQGAVELNWLEATLRNVEEQHKTAVLLMHIPPGIDAFESAKSGACSKSALFWKRGYLDSFVKTIQGHESALRDGYAGHLHAEDFRLLTNADGNPSLQIHIAPSVSRDHHNKPAFEVGVYDKESGNLVDYEVITLKSVSDAPGEAPQIDWQPTYDFRQESGGETYSPATLQTLSEILRANEGLRRRYLDFYKSQIAPGAPINMGNWRYYSCSETEISPEDYEKCACPAREANP